MRRVPMFPLLIVLVAAGCRDPNAPSQENCVKQAIFATQRATKKVSDAQDYAGAIAALESLKVETDRLNRLRDEFNAFAPPSSWERSRMRKHRSLRESANQKWTAALVVLREQLDDGEFPPDVRQRFDTALAEFDEARKQFWSAVEPHWD